MKYLEVTFTTHPCNETVNDVVSALAGEIGFESFVECEAGVQAYIQQTLFDEEALKEMIASIIFSDMEMNKKRIAIRKLKKSGLDPKFISMFMRLLEYASEI